MIECIIHEKYYAYHLWQLLSGFSILRNNHIVKIKTIKSTNNLPKLMVRVDINGVRVIFDLNDGYDDFNEAQVDYKRYYSELLSSHDFIVKRSYSELFNEGIVGSERIIPLGFYHKSTINGCFTHKWNSSLDIKTNIDTQLRRIPLSKIEKSFKSLHHTVFEHTPKISDNPTVLFLTRLWEPNLRHAKVELKHVTDKMNEERHVINQYRVNLVRECRAEFGDRAVAGLNSDAFTQKNYPDLISPSSLTSKFKYLDKVKNSEICVSNMGLHQSNGGKLSEYVAASRAIVSEKLHYQPTGSFRKNTNYLEFSTIDECINNIRFLMEEPGVRYKMMLENFRYYHDYARPDKLAINAIYSVLGLE